MSTLPNEPRGEIAALFEALCKLNPAAQVEATDVLTSLQGLLKLHEGNLPASADDMEYTLLRLRAIARRYGLIR